MILSVSKLSYQSVEVHAMAAMVCVPVITKLNCTDPREVNIVKLPVHYVSGECPTV